MPEREELHRLKNPRVAVTWEGAKRTEVTRGILRSWTVGSILLHGEGYTYFVDRNRVIEISEADDNV